MKKPSIAPDKSLPTPWEGSVVKKPWEYKVTAVIPCINAMDSLPLVIETLRHYKLKDLILLLLILGARILGVLKI